jgi:hypothetical protein
MKVLDLSHTQIQALAELGLYGGEIGDVGMEALGQAVARNGSLEELACQRQRVWYSRLGFICRCLED